MSTARFEVFLQEVMGLDSASIGSTTIKRAVQERAGANRVACLDGYWELLQSSASERQALIEEVVVPETWFFRDPEAFTALARFALYTLSGSATRRLRILSLPCSSGEEPYSIAMALLDAGLAPSRFSIDAVDISARALERARTGLYRANSFRGTDASFRQRFFAADRIHDRVRDAVTFHQANLLALDDPPGGAPYEVIFCRNLLIYFDRATQDRAVALLRRLLAREGVLFVGPSESGLLLSHSWAAAGWPLAFAFRPPDAAAARAPAPVPGREQTRPRADRRAPVRQRTAGTRAVRRSSGPTSASTQPAAAPAHDALERAEELANRGQIQAAREQCDAFIRANGPSAQALYLLGLLEDACGRTAKAMDHYRGAVYLDPAHEQALVHLATLIERHGDRAGARRLLARARRASAQGVGP